MANFRTKIFGLAGAAMMFSGMAFGQLCSTSGNASTPTLAVNATNNLRAEGQTELLPPMTLSCTSTGTGTATFNVLVQVPTVTNITSQLLSGSTSKTEITLTGGTASVPGTVSGNVVTFSGVTANYTNSGALTFTVSFIRVNASAIPSAGAFPTAISAQAFVSGTTNTTSGTSNSQIVAYAFSALSTGNTKVYSSYTFGNMALPTLPTAFGSTGAVAAGAVNSSALYAVCTSENANKTSSPDYVGVGFIVGVTEGFAGAWKTKADEQSGSPVAAASGTRIKLIFSNVPPGLNLFVPLQAVTMNAFNMATNPTGSPLIASLTTSETGAFTAPSTATSPGAVSGLVQLTVSGTTATAIYEIQTDNLTAIDNIAIPVTLSAGGNTITNYLTNPQLTVTTSLAPQAATASQVPSFATTASDIITANAVKFASCSTTLLFPFVTNANGFETGIAIANTSKDPFGTATPQSGTCSLNFYQSGVSGATNPAPVTAPNLTEGANQPYLAGEDYAFTLTQALAVNAANPATFQGYVIAACNFTYGHAFAYILGGLQPGMFVNPNNTAMGYLAIVVNRGAVSGQPDSAGN